MKFTVVPVPKENIRNWEPLRKLPTRIRRQQAVRSIIIRSVYVRQSVRPTITVPIQEQNQLKRGNKQEEERELIP